uniref:Uncharacterized protein n=1 Tax=Candidatus Kentrum eta TaxID=2126337 RepID=A0A450VT93_9GAMM|nr:MAG: hypothetical protein BECKH772B_GA0070898_108402 [Candidatus Kentron sp. H]
MSSDRSSFYINLIKKGSSDFYLIGSFPLFSSFYGECPNFFGYRKSYFDAQQRS